MRSNTFDTCLSLIISVGIRANYLVIWLSYMARVSDESSPRLGTSSQLLFDPINCHKLYNSVPHDWLKWLFAGVNQQNW